MSIHFKDWTSPAAWGASWTVVEDLMPKKGYPKGKKPVAFKQFTEGYPEARLIKKVAH